MREASLKTVIELDYHGEEAFNTISTNLAFVGSDVHKIVITSNNQSDGKSFVALQLTMNLARRGKRVCLVDADLRRSFLIQRTSFVTQGETWGLSHFLSGQCNLDDVMYQINVPNACIIPNSRTVSSPMVLLDSPVFNDMLNHLSGMFDYVIVDAPPIGMVVDAA